MRSYCVTAESVTEGHPDKICDQISDAILDACLARDPLARVAVETLASGNLLVIAGEITSTATLDAASIARQVIRDIGYTDPALGFDAEGCFILTNLRRQSPDIDRGVSRGQELGAGDQGVFYGYACDDGPGFMPLPVHLAHRLAMRLTSARTTGALPWLRPDGKVQVTMRYDAAGRPSGLASLVVSAQHADGVEQEALVRGIVERVICPEAKAWIGPETRLLINPTGRFVTGGPAGDTGLTGRKLMVDSYGGCARHGGGAFSGKDATKVDRSAAYMARYIAKTIVAAGLARRCEVALSYVIGQPRPDMLTIDTFGTETLNVEHLTAAVREVFPLSVSGVIDALDLRRPIFRRTAAYGHFGRENEGFHWERTDRVDALHALCRR